MRALSEPACVAAERQKKSHFDEGKMVPVAGIEPATVRLQIGRSTC
jgi:hypothetical protein